MIWKRKLRIHADTLASTFFDEFVQKSMPDIGERFRFDANVSSASGRKLQNYKFATALLAILDAERRDKAFIPVRECFERCFYPASFTQGIESFEKVRDAMGDLIKLIQPDSQPHPMSWAHNWLNDAGIEEYNPATLTLFAIQWQDYFIAAVKSLRSFKPIT